MQAAACCHQTLHLCVWRAPRLMLRRDNHVLQFLKKEGERAAEQYMSGQPAGGQPQGQTQQGSPLQQGGEPHQGAPDNHACHLHHFS